MKKGQDREARAIVKCQTMAFCIRGEFHRWVANLGPKAHLRPQGLQVLQGR